MNSKIRLAARETDVAVQRNRPVKVRIGFLALIETAKGKHL